MLSPTSLKSQISKFLKPALSAVKLDDVVVNEERKGYNIVLFKDSLAEILDSEYVELQTALLDYQLDRNIRIRINKNIKDPLSRSLIIRVPAEEDTNKVIDAISVIPTIAGSSIKYYLPHDTAPTNRCYIYLSKDLVKYAIKSTLLQMITLSTDLTISDINLFAPTRTLKDGWLLLPIQLSNAGMTYFSHPDINWRIFLLGITLHLKVSKARTRDKSVDITPVSLTLSVIYYIHKLTRTYLNPDRTS